MKDFMSRWAPPILMMRVIYLVSSLSTLPGPETLWWDFILKKTAHMVEYGLLFWLWARAINWQKADSQKEYWQALLLVLIYAISDEIHQSFTPGRFPKITDVGFDMLGAFLVYIKLLHFI